MDQISSNKKHVIIKAALAFCIAFIGIAISQTMLGPMVPIIQVTYNISLSQNGLLPFAQGVGAIIVLIISMAVADRFNKRTLMMIAYVIYNIVLYIAAFLPPYWLMVVLFFFVGVGTRLFDALANANMSELGAERKGAFLSLLHGFFGIGALIGPIIANTVLTKYDLGSSLLSIGCVCSVLFFISLLLSPSWKRAFPAEIKIINKDTNHSLLLLLRSKTMWILGLSCMLYVGFAIGIATWIPSYLGEMGASSHFAAAAVSLLWVGIISGRFVYSALSLKYSIKSLILVSNLIGGSVIICASIINTVELYVIGYIVSGFFIGAVTPLSVAIANKIYPAMAGRISSMIILFVSFGMMTIPPVIGVIAENVNFHTAIFILNLCPILIAALSVSLKTKQ